ncbi:MAG: glycosyltransferase family 4 protein [Bacteroidetes bacterium]|nr:glycosyltransferase family 4 protein [Bacteroidota bacterium]
MRYYKVDENKIKVIYHSTDKGFHPIDILDEEKIKIKEMIGSPEHIVLYVGMIENRKNILGILKTADILNKKNRGVKFVLVGKIGFGGEKLLEEIQKRENVVYLRNVDDLLLKKFYNISSAFLFPSFYEGFGVPPLEAMQSGLPVIAANNTALPEIINSAGLLHDANNYQAFAEDILKLIDDKDFYNNMKNLGIERAKKFSANNTVEGLVGVFNSFKQ